MEKKDQIRDLGGVGGGEGNLERKQTEEDSSQLPVKPRSEVRPEHAEHVSITDILLILLFLTAAPLKIGRLTTAIYTEVHQD